MGKKFKDDMDNRCDYTAKRERDLKNAIEYEKKEHPVTDFDFEPDKYRTDETPADITLEGKCLAYYDTQSSCWRIGDRAAASPRDRAFADFKELKKYLKDEENLDRNLEDLNTHEAQGKEAA